MHQDPSTVESLKLELEFELETGGNWRLEMSAVLDALRLENRSQTGLQPCGSMNAYQGSMQHSMKLFVLFQSQLQLRGSTKIVQHRQRRQHSSAL